MASNPPLTEIHISCFCTLNKLHLTIKKSSSPRIINLCHCSTCRHTTGQLCTSYLPFETPETSFPAENLVPYCPAKGGIEDGSFEGRGRDLSCQGLIFWFCKKCGSHMLRSKMLGNKTELLNPEELRPVDSKQMVWEVATGLVKSEDLRRLRVKFEGHDKVEETGDGGIAKWLPFPQSSSSQASDLQSDGIKYEGFEETAKLTEGLELPDPLKTDTDISQKPHPTKPQPTSDKEETLPLSCNCHKITLHITRPNPQSLLPHSPYSDLIKHLTPSDLPYASNPHDEKWWIRPRDDSSTMSQKRYFTGTCVCKSCRLSSGFEIQAWAFVPRNNIFFYLPDTSLGKSQIIPLDFSNPKIQNQLSSYSSNPGVTREFCGTCGATIFWRSEKRRELIDVSVGSGRGEGVRMEEWLDWCGDRVSFEEEVLGEDGEGGKDGVGREGLVRNLVEGLRGRDGV